MATVVLLAIGCATSAPDRSARTAKTLDDLRLTSSRTRTQIDTVLASLDALLNASPERLRAAYDKYDADVAKMKELAASIRETGDDLQNNGASYLKNWQKDASSISDPELRNIAEQRRSEISSNYKTMTGSVAGATNTFTAFLRDIDDIRKAIGNDLTPTGQSNVKNTAIVQNVRQESTVVASALQDAEQAIAGFHSQITPTAR